MKFLCFSSSSPKIFAKAKLILNRKFLSNDSSNLIDSFGRHHNYLRISLTEKCNLRCTYCMPNEGVQLSPQEKLLNTDEIIQIAQMFVRNMGVSKIRLTGGEPLIRKDLVNIVSELNTLKSDGLKTIGITTNAVALGTKRCLLLKQAGLDALNISLDSLVKVKYEFITRRLNTFDAVMRNIQNAINNDFPKQIKINCVMMKGFNDDELLDFVHFTKNLPIDVRFIEYMPFDSNKWKSEKLLTFEEMLKTIRKHFGNHNVIQLTDAKKSYNNTSKPYKVKGYVGQIGFITSMTNDFCSTCNRLRITADGNLKVCLFGNEEVSLRDAIRSGANEEALTQLVKSALLKKKERHSGPTEISQIAHCYTSKNHLLQSRFSNLAFFPKPILSSSSQFVRCFHFSSHQTYCSFKLSHVNASTGKSEMVDIGNKEITQREAIAEAKVLLGPSVFPLVKQNRISKGDVLGVAKISGIQAAKQTALLIPLCHSLSLSKIHITITLNDLDQSAHVIALVRTQAQTGVEMEALVAASIASLTLYDMCKSVSKNITISEVRLMKKSGGKSGVFQRD